MNILNRAAIKFEARNFISVDRRWLFIFWAGILPFIIDLGNNYVRTYIDRATENHSQFLYNNLFLFNFAWILPILALLVFPIRIAINGYHTNCLRNNEFQASYVYSSASNNYINFFVVEIVRSIRIILWSLLLIVPGIIKAVAYSMTGFIICDNPTLSSSEAIALSERITYGFKKDIAIMYLSFIPWYIFVALTIGIAAVYVNPYIGITEAMYYENLKRHAIETGVATKNEFAQ